MFKKLYKTLFIIEQPQGTENERIYKHLRLSDKYRAINILFLSLMLFPSGACGVFWVHRPWLAAAVAVFGILPLFFFALLANAHANYHGTTGLKLQCGIPTTTKLSVNE